MPSVALFAINPVNLSLRQISEVTIHDFATVSRGRCLH